MRGAKIVSDQEEKENALSLSRKQVGVGASIVAAILILNPVKEWFFTREEGKAQSDRIAHVESSLKDLSTQIDSRTEAILIQLKERDQRILHDTDKLERRIETLEASRTRPQLRSTN